MIFKWKTRLMDHVRGDADPNEIIFITDGGSGCTGKTSFTKELQLALNPRLKDPRLSAVASSYVLLITSNLMTGYRLVNGKRVDVKYPVNVICFDPPRDMEWDAEVLRQIIHWKLMHRNAHVLVFLPRGVVSLNGNQDFA